MNLKTLKDADVKNKTILYRAPYDIGVEKNEVGELVVKDDSRIVATIPTLEYLIDQNCKIVILTYVKRPEGRVVEELRTTPHAKKLEELIGCAVKKVDDCIGDKVKGVIRSLKPKEILMLENVRFYAEEEADDEDFAKKLCEGCDMIVFDGFPQAHRAAASTTGILKVLPAVAGFYFEKELTELSKLLNNPNRPFVVIIGGAKVEDKLQSATDFVEIADKVLIGGKIAKAANKLYEENPDTVVLATDFIDGDFDIGPETEQEFENIISTAKTIFWAGPLGKYEESQYVHGTQTIAQTLAQSDAETIIAGGDTIDAVKRLGDISKITHTSLAGGATLEFLAGKELPVLKELVKPE